MSHKQSFSYKGTGLPGMNQYYARINVLAQGHNAVTPVRLEPAAPRSQVKHSTSEPLCSLCLCFTYRSAIVHTCWDVFQSSWVGPVLSRAQGHITVTPVSDLLATLRPKA